MRATRRSPLILILAAIAVLLSGCWDHIELADSAWVTTLGFDEGSESTYAAHQIVALPAGLSGGQQTQSGGIPRPFSLVSQQANSLQESIAISNFVARTPRYDHTSNIVIGKSLAEKGISTILMFLVRSARLRPIAWITIAEPTALEVLNDRTSVEKLPSEVLLGLMDRLATSGLAAPVNTLGAATQRFLRDGQDLVIPVVKRVPPIRLPSDNLAKGGLSKTGLLEHEQLLIEGSALFQLGRMVGKVSGLDSKGLAWALGKSRGTVAFPYGKDGYLAVRLRSVRSSITVTNLTPLSARLSVNATAELTEIDSETFSLTSTRIKEASQVLARYMEDVIQHTLKITQEVGSDPLGVGRLVKRRDVDLWHKIEANWYSAYATTNFDVRVNAAIKYSGVIK